MVRKILFLFIMVLSCEVAYACTCERITHQKEFRRATAIFSGEVIDVKEDTSYVPPRLTVSPALQKIVDSTKRYLVTVRIERNFKGATGKEVVLENFQSDSLCTGMMLIPGEKYLIYAARKDGWLNDGGLCSRTVKLDKTSKEYRELQRSYRKWSR